MKKEDVKIIIQSYNYVRPYTKNMLLILLMVIVTIGLSIIQPIMWGHVLEAVLKLEHQKFTRLILWLLGLYIFQTIISFVQSYLSSHVNNSIICEMKENVFSKIMNYQMRLIDNMGVGDVLSHLEGDVQVIANVFTNLILNIIIAILKALIIGTIAIVISWPLAVVIIMMLPINYLIVDQFGSKLKLIQIELRKNMDKYYSGTQEYVTGIKSIKSQGAKKYIGEKFNKLIIDNKFIGIKMGKLIAASSGLTSLLNFITQIIVYVVGMYLLVNGKLTFALFVAFSSYTALLSGALLEITQINPKLQQAVVSIKRVNKILDIFEDNQEHWGSRNIVNVSGNILFKNVSFGYDNLLFKDLNIEFNANKKYAIVGLSGSGKSSLFGLLLKIYDIQEGKILIDGIDVNEINEECYRNLVGAVQQEPILFNMSIMENIKLGQKNVTDEQIYMAAKMANVDNDIKKMQDGYDTIINGMNDNLSVGQKQRIVLARTLLKNPKVILLDEVTSALDNISQYLVNDSINALRSTHTIISISHKISTIIDSDEIFVMDNGKIVGQGKHKDLIKKCECYKKMYDLENNGDTHVNVIA